MTHQNPLDTAKNRVRTILAASGPLILTGIMVADRGMEGDPTPPGLLWRALVFLIDEGEIERKLVRKTYSYRLRSPQVEPSSTVRTDGEPPG